MATNPSSITLGDLTVVLDRPQIVKIASHTTPGKTYDLKLFPSAVGVETICSCPSRRPCTHRKCFASICAVQLGAVVREGVIVRFVAPVVDAGPADPFADLAVA